MRSTPVFQNFFKKNESISIIDSSKYESNASIPDFDDNAKAS
jgi:hypothetical protein